MICILVLGIFVVVNAVLPPAHQPKLDIPGASSRGTGFSANELYGAAGTKNYPLPDCFTNESGFMCCNAELLDEMHKAYDDLRNRPEWISCNIQAITNSVQKRAEARFGLPFEVITGISDFASKAHFYHNFICKFEREGRIILAYATPRNGGDLQKLASAGIPGVGDKAELAAPAESGSAGAQSAPSGGANAAAGGAGDQATPSGGANAATVGVGSLPVGPQGSNLAAPSGGSAGVGGFGASGDLGSASAAAAPRGGQVGNAGGANAGVGGFGASGDLVSASAAVAPRGGQEGNASGANAGVGGSSQGGKLAAPYKLTRISV
uniref:Ground-like domain-containing protein n=1 Tax=Acrobeloides nanus TaxID=290746 RepID=A0A914CFA0_9BILA